MKAMPWILCVAAALAAALFYALWTGAVKTANSRIEFLNGQIANANATISKLEPYARRGARVPVTASHRPSLMGDGLVLDFQNTSGEALMLDLTLTSSSGAQSKQFRLSLPAASSPVKEIGTMQGWPAAVGDKIVMNCEGYEPTTLTVR